MANTFAGPPPASNASVTQAPQTQSWRDPQIYIALAVSGKSVSSHYDTINFVNGNVEEEIVVGGTGSHQVILKAGPKKLKL